VRVADEDAGGLAYDELDEDGRDALGPLQARGLVEVLPVDDEGGGAWLRLTWRGADALRDLGFQRE
jgi:hypothetical protein